MRCRNCGTATARVESRDRAQKGQGRVKRGQGTEAGVRGQRTEERRREQNMNRNQERVEAGRVGSRA